MDTLHLGGSMDCLMALNENQKIAYLAVLVYLSKTDGNVDKSEQEFLRDMAKLYGVSDARMEEIFKTESADKVLDGLKIIKDRRANLELIKDMCLMAHVDDELSDEEILFIGKVGLAMNVSLDKVEKISKWVIDRIIWLEEAKIIFEEA